MKILFLENHALFADTVVEQFLCTHDVCVVPSVNAGLAALERMPADVVLVDYDLEDGKGDELVRRLRASAVGVPVVAVSAHEEGNEALLDAGADAVCRKKEFRRIEEAIESARSSFAETLSRLQLDPPRTGSMLVRLLFGAEHVDIHASHTPRDSLGDLASALLTVAQSPSIGTATFNLEPEIIDLSLEADGDDLRIDVNRCSDHRRLDRGARLVFRRTARKQRTLITFLRAFRDLRRRCPPAEYEREWGHPFPDRAVDALQRLLARGSAGV